MFALMIFVFIWRSLTEHSFIFGLNAFSVSSSVIGVVGRVGLSGRVI